MIARQIVLLRISRQVGFVPFVNQSLEAAHDHAGLWLFFEYFCAKVYKGTFKANHMTPDVNLNCSFLPLIPSLMVAIV